MASRGDAAAEQTDTLNGQAGLFPLGGLRSKSKNMSKSLGKSLSRSLGSIKNRSIGRSFKDYKKQVGSVTAGNGCNDIEVVDVSEVSECTADFCPLPIKVESEESLENEYIIRVGPSSGKAYPLGESLELDALALLHSALAVNMDLLKRIVSRFSKKINGVLKNDFAKLSGWTKINFDFILKALEFDEFAIFGPLEKSEPLASPLEPNARHLVKKCLKKNMDEIDDWLSRAEGANRCDIAANFMQLVGSVDRMEVVLSGYLNRCQKQLPKLLSKLPQKTLKGYPEKTWRYFSKEGQKKQFQFLLAHWISVDDDKTWLQVHLPGWRRSAMLAGRKENVVFTASSLLK